MWNIVSLQRNSDEMKRIILSILFLLMAVWGWNMAGDYRLTQENIAEEVPVQEAQATQNMDQIFCVLVAANSFADVSAQTNYNFASNLARRYRSLSLDKIQDLQVQEHETNLDNTLKFTLLSSQEYAARQKNAGFYIYALRRIII